MFCVESFFFCLELCATIKNFLEDLFWIWMIPKTEVHQISVIHQQPLYSIMSQFPVSVSVHD